MFEKSISGLPLWVFENLSQHSKVRHFVSGRAGGVSTGEKGALNLSYKVNDLSEHVHINRTRLANAMGIGIGHLVFPVQTHSNNVIYIREEYDALALEDADALITNARGICLAVMGADCVPILLFDPVTKAIGAVHAGWRGTTGKILTAAVKEMQQHFHTNPSDLFAGIGPSIGPGAYEVGEEVIAAAERSFGINSGLIIKTTQGKGFFNLWEANRSQLLSLGLKPERIEVSGICTFTNHEQFFSARRSQNQAGRFAAGIMLL